MNRSFGLAALFVVLGSTLASGADPVDLEPTLPDSGLVEQAGNRLVQLDVGIRGPRDAVATLEADEFELLIAGERIEGIVVDRQCGTSEAAETPEEPREEIAPAVAAPAPRGVSLLFYFDQTHLTMGGRARALNVARDLVREMVGDGVRAMVVSSGREVRTFAEITGNQQELLAAFDTLEADHKQWVTWASYEPRRIEEILRELENGEIERAAAIARRHMRDEQWHTGRALHRFETVLGTMADLDVPKAVIYFADTMRSESGGHYMSFFGASQSRPGPSQEASMIGAGASVLAAGHAFQRVIDAAGANGLRFYTVQAEGLLPDQSRGATDARNSLSGLALETGGRAFLNGVRAKRIATKIREDLSCVYILSFDADLVAHDRTLPVRVRVDRPKIVASTRGSIVVQSPSRRLTSRLMAAFAAPGALDSDIELRGTIIPLGFADGRYSALAQVVVPPSLLSTTTWDLGLSLVSRGKVSDDASGRVELQTPGVRVVLEAQFELVPGPFELVGVAHERTANAISTSETEGELSDPNDAPVSISPISVIQPSAGAFIRDGEVRSSGALALADGEMAIAERPTAVVSLVCRAKRRGGSLRVTRELIGDTRVELEPLELDLNDDRCAHVRDLLPAGSLGAGDFRYHLAVHDRDELITETERSFRVNNASSAN